MTISLKSALAVVVSILLSGCAQSAKNLATEPYPDEQAQVKQRLDEIWKSAEAKELAKLKSFHLYGPKFTEFKDGAPRGDAVSGEAGEQGFFSAATEARVEMKELKINVFGDVAVATFEGNFSAKMGGQPIADRAQSTMVFVKDQGEWKIAHEHFSSYAPPPVSAP
jgi:hypothetical protein